ncbi:MAG: hypothetical protein Q4B50_05745 [Bacillota bacterium]|nr:hypothetical protein [Bacillota bacterium]
MLEPQKRLKAARLAAARPEKQGIGCLGEKQLHAILKYYYEPRPEHHEIPVQGFVADICNESGIIEIQTGSFDKLRRKLECFLEHGPVTLVYPLPHRKWLRWIDPQTGEISEARKSPKTGQPAEACFELGKIQALLSHKNLHIRLLLLDVEEHRYLNGWSRDGKKGSTRAERIPLSLVAEIALDAPVDYLQLLPAAGLPEPFTRAELAKLTRLSPKRNQYLLRCLLKLGLLRQEGKRGRSYLYFIEKKAATAAEKEKAKSENDKSIEEMQKAL